MLVNKTIEQENGSVTFEGELSQEELDLVLTMGLNYLLAHGAIPFTSKDAFIISPDKGEIH